jgi:hypothetical protein
MRQANAVLACLGLVSALGCGGKPEPKAAVPRAAARPAGLAANDAVPPYSYPAPVAGHFADANYGNYVLTDGIAYAGSDGGTVVVASEKAIASPILTATGCPMTYARALLLIRNSGLIEVRLDAAGQSAYFSVATPYDGRGREQDVGGRYWRTSGKLENGRITGKVEYKGKGGFTFDLPVAIPKVDDVGFGDIVSGTRFDSGRRAPSEAEVRAAFLAIRKAALAKDLRGMLAAQGFDAKQSEAIRGLPGIDADLGAHADRFLDPGTPEEADVGPGYGRIGSRGQNAKGQRFANYYEFAPCGDTLVMVGIGLNPQ